MDIVVIGSASLKNEEQKKKASQAAVEKTQFVERRRNQHDRRKSVRDGVVVTLSTRNDRRTQPDRRRVTTD